MFTARYGLNLSLNRLRFVPIGLRLCLLSSTDDIGSQALVFILTTLLKAFAGGYAADGNELDWFEM